jgi:hypothetical protein
VVLQLGGLGVGLTTPHRRKIACYETVHKTSDLDGFLGNKIKLLNEYESVTQKFYYL